MSYDDTAAHRDGPLRGCTVVVTRSEHQSGALAIPLRKLGARVIAFPVIETVEPADWTAADRAITELDSYDWTVFTSANAVDRFIERIERLGYSVALLRETKIAVVGSATARRLAAHDVQPDVVPGDFRAEGLIAEFERLGVADGCRVLIPRALQAREILPEALRKRGCTAEVVPVYRTVSATPESRLLDIFRQGEADVITFTSPSTFTSFAGILKGAGLDLDTLMADVMCASIGPVTSTAIRAAGYDVACEAEESTVDGLISAILHCAGGRKGYAPG